MPITFHSHFIFPQFVFSASKSVPQVAMTTAGNLPSKKIIHVALTGPDKVKKMTKEILQMAEKSGMQSVAFPALGTGTCKIQINNTAKNSSFSSTIV